MANLSRRQARTGQVTEFDRALAHRPAGWLKISVTPPGDAIPGRGTATGG